MAEPHESRVRTHRSHGSIRVVTSLPGPPRFQSTDAYDDRVNAPRFWAPYVRAILARHGLRADQIEAGSFGTSPTFRTDRQVVKLFGYDEAWQFDHDTELAAHLLLADHPEIPAPALTAHGRLYDEPEDPWPYLVTERIPGRSWYDADLSDRQRLTVAEQLGDVVRQVHQLSPPTARNHGPLG